MSPSNEPVVLIVEDEPDVAETYRLYLDPDYDVRVAADGDEGLEMLDDDVDVRFARTVSATRNLLDAAGRAGVGRVVHRSSAMVYGAHSDNPVPLDEHRPRRANPEYPPAHHHALAEELVEQFDADHPEATVVVLRPVTVLGPGEDHVLVAHLETPRLLTVRDREPPWQFVHSDDLAEALHLAVTSDMAGVYNVAADGWLSLGELCGILGAGATATASRRQPTPPAPTRAARQGSRTIRPATANRRRPRCTPPPCRW